MAHTTDLVPRIAWGAIVTLAVGGAILTTSYTPKSLEPHPPAPPTPAPAIFQAGPEHETYATIEALRTYSARADPPARVVVVPHHLVAAQATAHGIASLAQLEPLPRTVVVLSPDHFKACDAPVCVTSGVFNTFYGDITTADDVVATLRTSPLVHYNEALFHEEHGIRTILPFIRALLPDVSIVPMVVAVHDHPNDEEEYTLLALLTRILHDPHTALVVSSDFSHYLPLEEANAKDTATAQAICTQDAEALRALENPAQSDCPACLWYVHKLTHRLSLQPNIVWHSNSAELLHDEHIPETTSHMVVRYTDHAEQTPCALP